MKLPGFVQKIIAFVIRHWKIVAAVGFVFMCASAYAGWRVYNYIEHDPTFCTSCHLMQDPFERWSKSGHKDVNCHTCHPSNPINNLKQLYLTATNSREKVEEKADVPPEKCKECHLSSDDRWKQIETTVGHKIHAIDKKIECLVCHGPGVHQFVPNDEMCKKCHGELKVAFEKMSKNHCTTCHKFLATGRDSLVPRIEDCAECHTRQVGAPPAIDAGWHPDQPCSMCHPVHDRPEAVADVTVERDGLAVNCAKCHDQVVPVSHESCRDCHKPHTAFDPKKQCVGCHEDRKQAIEPPWKHECGDCHRPHTPGLTSLDTCVDCHNDKVKDLEEKAPMGHDACERCHTPHERADNKPLACSDCHPLHAIEMKGNAHKACTDCHNPHRAKEPPNCSKCHEKQLSALAPGKHVECGGCHKPHKPATAAVTQCTTCHTGNKAMTVLKGHEKCDGCHKPHAGPEARPMDNCQGCHKEVAAAVALEPEKHRVCNDCHTPHKPFAQRVKQCAECHPDNKKSLADQPKGHQVCQDCHPKHAVRPMSCDSCHQKQRTAVNVSKAKEHKDCQGCHGGVHSPDAPAPSTNVLCVSCHKEIPKKGLHASKTHNDCIKCHGNHGPTRPVTETCINCHPLAKIPKHPPMPAGDPKCYGCHNFLGDQKK